MQLEENIRKNIQAFEKKQRRSRLRAYIITGTIILVSAIGFWFYRQSLTRTEELTVKQARTDSLFTNVALLTDTLKKLNQERLDSVIRFTVSFLTHTKKDSLLCTRFYADTVTNYFGFANIPLPDIIRSKKADNKKYPAEISQFDPVNIKVILNEKSANVFATNVINFKDSTQRKDPLRYNYEIIISNDYKVSSIVSALQQKDFAFRKAN